MKVAFVGCGHGNLDLIYNNLAGSNVDVLIVCGDFEVFPYLSYLHHPFI